MKKISKILAACDLSDYSAPVVEYAVELATGQKAELVVANVIHQRDIDAMEKAIERIRMEIDNFPVTVDGYIKGMRKQRDREILNEWHRHPGLGQACIEADAVLNDCSPKRPALFGISCVC